MVPSKQTVARFHIKRFAIVFVIAILNAALFTFIGLYLGKVLGHQLPVLAFVFVIISFPVTQFILFKVMRRLTTNFLKQ